MTNNTRNAIYACLLLLAITVCKDSVFKVENNTLKLEDCYN